MQKVSQTLMSTISQAGWCIPGIPAIREDHGQRLTPGKDSRYYLKNICRRRCKDLNSIPRTAKINK
jgi:hypothetical protein